MNFDLNRHSQTLRYEYHSKLYQLLHHRAVELHDQQEDISIVDLIVEAIHQNKQTIN